jgi:hypothetical protein
MADGAGMQGKSPASCTAALPRISPAPASESTVARLQAQIRFAASTTVLLRWALIALVGGPALLALIGFLSFCGAGQVCVGSVEGQLGPIVSGTLFLCVTGTGTALGLALPTAAGFRALQRARLRRQVAALPSADAEAALRPLRRDSSADTRKIVEPLLHELRAHHPAEVAPAAAPATTGNEPAPCR